MRKIALTRKTWIVIFLAAVVTLVATVVTFNFVPSEKRIEQRISRQFSVDDPRFSAELGVLLGPAFLDGNFYTALQNGDQIFPEMLAAIRGAKKSITFETYIYWSGDIGRQFAEALSERARAGVRVHVLLDWVGSAKMDSELMKAMAGSGAQVLKYHPPHWSYLGRMNNRTHRKLLVVDGQTAFTGGVGIAPQWTGDAQDPDHWRDTHFKVSGPVVAQMQAVFLDNWITVSGEVLHGPSYFPALAAVGNGRAQMFSSSPTGGSESMALMYIFAITSAAHSIDLAASYFVPDKLTVNALLDAMKRGVKLRIIVPGEHMDSDTVRSASRALWEPLLAAGALIAEYQPTMYHCKVMIVDGLLTSVGSTNFDNRSFRLNDEATLNIIDAAFAKEQTMVFDKDLMKSRQMTLADWKARPNSEKFQDWFASLIGAQL